MIVIDGVICGPFSYTTSSSVVTPNANQIIITITSVPIQNSDLMPASYPYDDDGLNGLKGKGLRRSTRTQVLDVMCLQAENHPHKATYDLQQL